MSDERQPPEMVAVFLASSQAVPIAKISDKLNAWVWHKLMGQLARAVS